jgi:Uma2 family endonuclease
LPIRVTQVGEIIANVKGNKAVKLSLRRTEQATMQTLLDLLTEQRIIYQGITWRQFKLIQAGFAESPGIRLFYYEGAIEIFMPGREHEVFSRLIGFLIGLFCLEKSIEFEPTGSMIHEREGEVSAQANESYCFGLSKPIPDLVIEVVVTSGGTQKLQRYQALQIPEVWFWQDGLFSLYRLRQDHYEKVTHSEIPELASLDINLLTRCVLMAQTSRLEAANEFRNALK